MKCPVLETYVANKFSSVISWANKRWQVNASDDCTATTVFQCTLPNVNDWWVIKASKGNGGKDIWFMNSNNYKEVSLDSTIPRNEELVVQKYKYTNNICHPICKYTNNICHPICKYVTYIGM